MDVLTPEQRHKNMQNIKSKNTSIETILCKALWSRGVRYRKNVSSIKGKPDIAIKKYKIAIFCDSEFFHGKDWDKLKERLEKSDNSEFWIKKISRNRERDTEIDAELTQSGWKVLRFWGDEIKKNTDECVKTIIEILDQTRQGNK